MVRDEIAGALASMFPEATLEWRDEYEIHVDGPIHVDAPVLDDPQNRPNRRAREIVLRFDRESIDRLATMTPLERAQSMERLDQCVEREMVRYDDGRSAPRDDHLDPFVIHCGAFLVD